MQIYYTADNEFPHGSPLAILPDVLRFSNQNATDLVLAGRRRRAPPRVHLASEFGSRLIIALSAVIYAIIMHTCGTRRHASSSDKIQLRSVTRIVPVPRNVSRDTANARWKGMDGWQSTTNRLESRESIESSAPSVIIHPRPLLPRGFELTDELFPIDRN